MTETISCACCTRTVISLLSHPAAVLLSLNVFVFAILETFILLTVSLLLFYVCTSFRLILYIISYILIAKINVALQLTKS